MVTSNINFNSEIEVFLSSQFTAIAYEMRNFNSIPIALRSTPKQFPTAVGKSPGARPIAVK
jgi:hypothetical protein